MTASNSNESLCARVMACVAAWGWPCYTEARDERASLDRGRVAKAEGRWMAVYRGVVKDNRVELEGNTRLPDGARVEVRPIARTAPVDAGMSVGTQTVAEEALLQDLLASGILEERPAAEFDPAEPFVPVTVRGEPLSAQIIRERR